MGTTYSIKHLCKTCKRENNWIGCFECEGDWYEKKEEIDIKDKYETDN